MDKPNHRDNRANGLCPLPNLAIVVVASPGPGEVVERQLCLPTGATVADAVQASGLLGDNTLLPWPACGIWGRTVEFSQTLQDGDRVELYRPLAVDPKVARRERFTQQGARTAGLFARQRTQTNARP